MTSDFLKRFELFALDERSTIYAGQVPKDLLWNKEMFERVWEFRPPERDTFKRFGSPVKLPRDQQAFGATYHYPGSDENSALPIPKDLKPLLVWSQEQVDSQLNGMLLNFYNGSGDYIGQHHDKTKGLIPDTPIVTISFGETRIFRLTKWRGNEKIGQHDFPTPEGRVFVMPLDNNKAWKHEVVKRTRYHGRRISVTIRAFSEGVLPPEQYFE